MSKKTPIRFFVISTICFLLCSCGRYVINRRSILGSFNSQSEDGADGSNSQGGCAGEKIPPNFSDDILPIMNKYCTACHGPKTRQSGLDLTVLAIEPESGKVRERWQKVLTAIAEKKMPPTEEGPDEVELTKLTDWVIANSPQDKIASQRVAAEACGEPKPILDLTSCQAPTNPGWASMRRLNRVEYNNTVRDLLGDASQPANDFAENSDGVTYGFDNNGESLALGLSQTEDFVAAAEKIVKNLGSKISCPDAMTAYDPCVREVLVNLANRAYRRFIEEPELADLLHLVDLALTNQQTVDDGIKIAAEAILLSPHFLFRVEKPKQEGTELSNFELASRLSYFLWNSMPDEELWRIASRGELNEKVLMEQTLRLLNHPKASSFFANFAEQWLESRKLEKASPDPALFPLFTAELKQSMRRQVGLFFEDAVRRNTTPQDIVSSDTTFINASLASHYGINFEGSPDNNVFQKISISGPRQGVFSLGSVFVVTSNPDRTSLVKRGKWVLQNLLCKAPPDPPPNLPPLEIQNTAGLSQRKRMEIHRTDPACASCHQSMDPIGSAFENFDAIGRWRTQDGNDAVDASGQLPSGQSFHGPEELGQLLKKRREIPYCFAEKVATYAIGRGMRDEDRCLLGGMVNSNQQKNAGRIQQLILGIVQSALFRNRIAEKESVK